MNELNELCDLAGLAAIDGLDENETRAFELHLTGCPECVETVRLLRDTAAMLSIEAAATPPPGLRDKVLQKVMSAAGGVLVRRDEGEWVDLPFPGVQTKRLFMDKVTGSVTSLVRVGPGAFYPRHVHAGLEHLYVLEGDLTFEDHTLYAGDYEVMGLETCHSNATSKGGCTVLIVNNVHDRILR